MPNPGRRSPSSPFRSPRTRIATLVAAVVVAGSAGAWVSFRSGDRAEGNLSQAESAMMKAGEHVEEALRWLERRSNAAADELSRVIEQNQPRVLLAQAAERLTQRLGGFAYRPGDRGENWQPLAEATFEGHRSTVILVHGLDEPGDIWDELAPALAHEGHRVLRFNYANDQSPVVSADQFAAFLEGPVREAGVDRLSVVCHSMGGLISRDVLTRYLERPEWAGPEINHLITVGTPNQGSPVAALQPVGEARELIARVWTSRRLEPSEMLGILVDGSGEAAEALAFGSAYLTELNSRPLPADVSFTIIAADASAEQKAALRELAESAPVAGLVGEQARELLLAKVDQMTNTVGDGVVPVTSTPLEGVDDYVLVTANHRSLLRTLPLLSTDPVPPAIPIIKDRLAGQLGSVPQDRADSEDPASPAPAQE